MARTAPAATNMPSAANMMSGSELAVSGSVLRSAWVSAGATGAGIEPLVPTARSPLVCGCGVTVGSGRGSSGDAVVGIGEVVVGAAGSGDAGGCAGVVVEDGDVVMAGEAVVVAGFGGVVVVCAGLVVVGDVVVELGGCEVDVVGAGWLVVVGAG